MLIPMRSTLIDAVSYDGAARRLYVQLRAGNAYTYDSVPPHVFQRFVEADSPGAYYNRVIKGFRSCRVEDDGWSGGQVWNGEPFG
ncbi:MAG: KTSC domain-containing protein [Pseudomonadota bacterium]